MNSINLALSVISFMCLLLGAPLNFLALAYFTKNPSRTLANKMFMIVSAIDAILCLSMLYSFAVLVDELEEAEAIHSTICQIHCWIFNIFSRLSLFLSSILSVMRAISLHNPFTIIPNKPIISLISLEFLYLVLFECSPDFRSHRLHTFTYGVCDWSTAKKVRGAYHMFYSLAYYLPIVLTIGSSLASLCLLRRNRNKFSELQGEEANNYANQCYASNTIFIIVIIYAVCNIPYAFVLSVVDIEIMTGLELRYAVFAGAHVELQSFGSVYLVAINAAITPFVFILRLKEFRYYVKRWIKVLRAQIIRSIRVHFYQY